jgi:hypothetical protein
VGPGDQLRGGAGAAGGEGAHHAIDSFADSVRLTTILSLGEFVLSDTIKSRDKDASILQFIDFLN